MKKVRTQEENWCGVRDAGCGESNQFDLIKVSLYLLNWVKIEKKSSGLCKIAFSYIPASFALFFCRCNSFVGSARHLCLLMLLQTSDIFNEKKLNIDFVREKFPLHSMPKRNWKKKTFFMQRIELKWNLQNAIATGNLMVLPHFQMQTIDSIALNSSSFCVIELTLLMETLNSLRSMLKTFFSSFFCCYNNFRMLKNFLSLSSRFFFCVLSESITSGVLLCFFYLFRLIKF